MLYRHTCDTNEIYKVITLLKTLHVISDILKTA